MSLTEFDQKEYDRNRRREGILEGKEETARNMLSRRRDLPPNQPCPHAPPGKSPKRPASSLEVIAQRF